MFRVLIPEPSEEGEEVTKQWCWQQGGSCWLHSPAWDGKGRALCSHRPQHGEGGLGEPSGAPLTSPSVNSTGILEKAQVSGRTCGPQGTITCHLFTFRRSPAVGISPDVGQPLLLFTSGNRPPTMLPMNVLYHIPPPSAASPPQKPPERSKCNIFD